MQVKLSKEEFINYLLHPESTPKELASFFEALRYAANESLTDSIQKSDQALNLNDPLTEEEAKRFADEIINSDKAGHPAKIDTSEIKDALISYISVKIDPALKNYESRWKESLQNYNNIASTSFLISAPHSKTEDLRKKLGTARSDMSAIQSIRLNVISNIPDNSDK
jgi:hypothetical protein